MPLEPGLPPQSGQEQHPKHLPFQGPPSIPCTHSRLGFHHARTLLDFGKHTWYPFVLEKFTRAVDWQNLFPMGTQISNLFKHTTKQTIHAGMAQHAVGLTTVPTWRLTSQTQDSSTVRLVSGMYVRQADLPKLLIPLVWPHHDLCHQTPELLQVKVLGPGCLQ